MILSFNVLERCQNKLQLNHITLERENFCNLVAEWGLGNLGLFLLSTTNFLIINVNKLSGPHVTVFYYVQKVSY